MIGLRCVSFVWKFWWGLWRIPLTRMVPILGRPIKLRFVIIFSFLLNKVWWSSLRRISLSWVWFQQNGFKHFWFLRLWTNSLETIFEMFYLTRFLRIKKRLLELRFLIRSTNEYDNRSFGVIFLRSLASFSLKAQSPLLLIKCDHSQAI